MIVEETMVVPHLPPEIYGLIIDIIINKVDIKDVAQLRLVSSFFANEVVSSVIRTGLFVDKEKVARVHATHNKSKSDSFIPFVARYLLRRPLRERSWKANISAFLNQLVDDFVPSGTFDDRLAIMVVLCQHIADFKADNKEAGWYRGILMKQGLPWQPKYFTQRDYEYHMCQAAILLKRPDIYLEVLRGEEEWSRLCIDEFASEFFGSALYAAVKVGDRALVQEMMSRGVSIDHDTCSAFVPAVVNNDPDMLEFLLDTNPSRISMQIQYAIYDAIIRGRDDLACRLLEYTDRQNLQLAFMEGLRIAVQKNKIHIVKMFLERGANPSEARRWSPQNDIFITPTPVENAAFGGFNDMLWLLLDHGAELNQHTLPRALRAALARNHVDTVRLLLERSEHAKILSKGRRCQVVAEGIHFNATEATLALICERRFIDFGALPVSFEESGWSPKYVFYDACFFGNARVVEALLDAGLPLDCPRGRAKLNSPMEAARAGGSLGSEDVVRLLLDRGAEPVDVARMEMAHEFEKGHYPRRIAYARSGMPELSRIRYRRSCAPSMIPSQFDISLIQPMVMDVTN